MATSREEEKGVEDAPELAPEGSDPDKGASVAATLDGSSGSRGSSAIVPVVDLAESHQEDGRLLRMFIAREQHLKANARTIATNNWLIPSSFYDEWVDAYTKKYAPVKFELSEEFLESRTKNLRTVLKDILKSPQKASVEALEACLRDCHGDVYKLRDTLLAAVKNLMSPRRILGKGGGKPLSEEAILALKMQRQVRLREVVMACLNEIHASGVGGEVLNIAMNSVRNLIEKFENRADDVCTAVKGDQWYKLKELMGNINGRPLALENGGDEEAGGSAQSSRTSAKHEGKGTKALVEMALTEFGGQATTQQIFEWVESHPDITSEYSSIRVNQNMRVNKRTKDPDNAKAIPVWHGTIRSVLSCHFSGGRIKGRGFLWYRKGEKPEGQVEAIADAPQIQALLDAPQNVESEGSQLPSQKERSAKKKAAPKRCKNKVADGIEGSGPKRRRKSEATTTDDCVVQTRRPRKAKVALPPLLDDDPLLCAIDAAVEAAS